MGDVGVQGNMRVKEAGLPQSYLHNNSESPWFRGRSGISEFSLSGALAAQSLLHAVVPQKIPQMICKHMSRGEF